MKFQQYTLTNTRTIWAEGRVETIPGLEKLEYHQGYYPPLKMNLRANELVNFVGN